MSKKDGRCVIRLGPDATQALIDYIKNNLETVTGASAFYLVEATQALTKALTMFERPAKS